MINNNLWLSFIISPADERGLQHGLTRINDIIADKHGLTQILFLNEDKVLMNTDPNNIIC